jgi:hypothetical protein
MTKNESPRERLARLVYNPDDRDDLINAMRDGDNDTIAAITDDPAIVAAVHEIVHPNSTN